ncbi:tetratricopeptide repeat protein [Actinophytocola sp.]|uniref:tetratricopeptide repeat protein n=1 Tax=Actinophytocola sp. TaxID=1872138 RepID=UPI00389AAA17
MTSGFFRIDRTTTWSELAALADADPLAHIHVVNALKRLGRVDDAEAFLRRTLERWPEDHHPNYDLAELLHSQERFDEAAAVYRKLMDGGRDNGTAVQRLAKMTAERGDVDEAMRLLAHNRGMFVVDTLIELGTSHGRVDQVVSLLREKSRQGDHYASSQLLALLGSLGRTDERLALYDETDVIVPVETEHVQLRRNDQGVLGPVLTLVHPVPPDHLAEYEQQLSQSPRVRYSVHLSTAWEAVLESAEKRAGASLDGAALVSVVLCHPGSVVLTDLISHHEYLDRRSGAAWDLHFAGYRAFGKTAHTRKLVWPTPRGIPLWQFRPADFDEIRRHIHDSHTVAVAEAPASSPFVSRPWKYSGRPELVSFMAYRDHPGLIDWLSLRAVRLVDAHGRYVDHSLGEIVEVMSDWREDDSDELRALAPGEPPRPSESAVPIGRALAWLGATVAGGVAGNAAYDLIKLMTNP